MKQQGKVLIITGPAGSGKTTLAEFTANKLSWKYVSEDEYWVQHNWSGLRTEEQEKTVQKEVTSKLLEAIQSGQGVVLEFILYKDPPNPLTEYQAFLKTSNISFDVVALKPSIEEIRRRLIKRGRANDLEDIETRIENCKNQIRCLESSYIDPRWVIDPSNNTVDELYQKVYEIISKG